MVFVKFTVCKKWNPVLRPSWGKSHNHQTAKTPDSKNTRQQKHHNWNQAHLTLITITTTDSKNTITGMKHISPSLQSLPPESKNTITGIKLISPSLPSQPPDSKNTITGIKHISP
jgi:hypothetical protein